SVQFFASRVLFLSASRYHLFPFPVYRVLSRSFEYYGNSVAMSLSAWRRSRICAYQTLSAFRCPVRFLEPVHYWSFTRESVTHPPSKGMFSGDIATGLLR